MSEIFSRGGGYYQYSKPVKVLMYCFLIPFTIIITANLFFSLFQTTYTELNQSAEIPLYKKDNPLLLLFLLFVTVTVFRCMEKRNVLSGRDRMGKAALIIAGGLSLFFVLIFRAVACSDSAAVNETALKMLRGDYSTFDRGGYLFRHPYQLGIAALLQAIYKVFGPDNFIVFQLLNCAAIVGTLFFLHRMTDEISGDARLGTIARILSMFLLPLFLYATFIYGEVIALFFISGALYMAVRCLKSDEKKYAFYAGLFMGPAVILKTNSYVAVIAMSIILLLKALQGKKWTPVLLSVSLVLLPKVMSGMLEGGYAYAAGIDGIPEGSPALTWIAMGLQENEAIECGWYNGYSSNVYKDYDYDRALASQACLRSIEDSLTGFAQNPRWAVHYFHRKFVSQWNDPTCMGIIVNEWASRHVEGRSGPAMSLIYGGGGKAMSIFMNIYQSLILLCAAVFCITKLRRITLEQGLLILVIFGGYLCHMLWEAKGRYALGYFVLMLPLAAGGMCRLLDGLEAVSQKYKNSACRDQQDQNFDK